MSRFAVHTKDSAPVESAPLLESAEQAFGFIPNLLGVFAESPATLEGYLSLSQLVDKSSFPIRRSTTRSRAGPGNRESSAPQGDRTQPLPSQS